MDDKSNVRFFSSQSPRRPERDYNMNKNMSWCKGSKMHHIRPKGNRKSEQSLCTDGFYTMMINDPNLDIGVEELLGDNRRLKGSFKDRMYASKKSKSPSSGEPKFFNIKYSSKSEHLGNTNLQYTKFAVVQGRLKQVDVCVKVKDADERHCLDSEKPFSCDGTPIPCQRLYPPRRVDICTSKFLPHYQYLEPYQYRYQTARNKWGDCQLCYDPAVTQNQDQGHCLINIKTSPTHLKKETMTKPDPDRHFRTWKQREQNRQNHQERHNKIEEKRESAKGKNKQKFSDSEKGLRKDTYCESNIVCPNSKEQFITPISGLPEENDLRLKTGRTIIKMSKDYMTKYTTYDQREPSLYKITSSNNRRSSHNSTTSANSPGNGNGSNFFEIHEDEDECYNCVCRRRRNTEMINTLNPWRAGACFNNKVDSVLKRYQIHNPRYF